MEPRSSLFTALASQLLAPPLDRTRPQPFMAPLPLTLPAFTPPLTTPPSVLACPLPFMGPRPRLLPSALLSLLVLP